MNLPAVAIGAGGLFILYRALSRGDTGRAPTTPPAAGGSFSVLVVPELLDQAGPAGIPKGHTLTLSSPSVSYTGPATDAYTYASIQQWQSGRWVTVYGSGVAGIRLPASSGQRRLLVPETQEQPDWCGGGTGARLCLVSFPGPGPTPICGALPKPGLATLLVEIYERASPADGDGYSAPTCNARKPVLRAEFKDTIRFGEDWA